MNELTKLTIAEAREKLVQKEISSAELTDSYIGAIETANASLNAYVALTFDQARAMAKASDERLASGSGGALEGIPLGIKDLFCTKGVHSQACSHILDGFKPRYESTVTANLWADGAVMLGKLNMDEFAMGSSNETSYYADLWPLLALGRSCLCLIAGSGRTDYKNGARFRDHAEIHGVGR